MVLAMEYHLQAEPDAKKISMAVKFQGRMHLLTIPMPHVEKRVTRKNLIFKFTPMPSYQVRIRIYENPNYEFVPVPKYPAESLTHLFSTLP